MKKQDTHKSHFDHFPWSHRIRYRLGERDALLPNAAIGLLSGVVTGLVITAFLAGIEFCKQLLMGIGGSTAAEQNLLASAMANFGNDFESIDATARFVIVASGAVILGLVFQCLSPDKRSTGLNHTLLTLHNANAHFPLKNFLVQFFGGIVALASGQSGGREGPGIHLGAASSTLLAQQFHLPDNALRTLTACGTAAAIAAGFNTPVAGVIFAMEVIVMEYTVIGFLPVIIAAIAATLISNSFFGSESIFTINTLSINWLTELPLLIMLAIACAFAALSFIKIQAWVQPLCRLPVSLRFSLAGLLTAAIGTQFPQVLGMGFDSIHDILLSPMLPYLLLGICALKIIATATSSAVGMPIGIIGPSLFIGATLGAAFGTLGQSVFLAESQGIEVYVLLAMGGVMSGLLNAPLAAVIAVMELSGTSQILLPCALVVVISNLLVSTVFRQRSANEILLQASGIVVDSMPVAQALNRVGLSRITNTHISMVYKADELTSNTHPESPVVIQVKHDTDDSKQLSYWFLEPANASAIAEPLKAVCATRTVNASNLFEVAERLSIKLRRLEIIELGSTLNQARRMLADPGIDGLYVIDGHGPLSGIVMQEDLAQYLAQS